MKRVVAVAVAIFALAIAAAAADREYKAMVKAIERHYQVRGKGLPLVARMALRLTRPMHGVEVKIAEFPELPSRIGSMHDFEEVVARAIGPQWKPMVRVFSRRTGEHTYLYMREERGKMVLLIAAIEPGEAAIVQVKLKPEKLERWMEDPVKLARTHRPAKGGPPTQTQEPVLAAAAAPALLPIGVPEEQLTAAHYDSPVGGWKVSSLK